MSKVLQEKINELFAQTKDLKSFSEIKPHCDQFNEWVATQNYSEKSLGTLFSRYGLYSKFRDIPLEQGKNAELIPKYDADGRVKGHELKHYVPLLCGLNNQQWQERNQSTRAIDRLENSTELDPDTYLKVTGKLLSSEDPHELAVGIIAATGRRPHEVIARAKFYPVKGKPYHVMFEGQGKKRGEKPVFEIATLYSADYIIKSLARLRRESSTKALLKEVATEFPKSLTRQNLEIDKRRNGSLNRVVRAYFGDKGDKTPVLAFRHGEAQDNNKALRAAYAVLATERDCQGSFGAKILHASRLLGHFVKEIKSDRDLANLGTSAGYSDYFTTKPVPFATAPEKEKTHSIRVNSSDLEIIKSLQERWQLPNQQSVVSRLIERHELTVELGKQLQEFKAHINQLEKEKLEMSQVKPQPQAQEIMEESLEAKVERLIEEKLSKALSNISVGQPQVQPSQSKPATQPSSKQQEAVDLQGYSHAELWATKVSGASEEKIRRSFNAIALYNDTVATGDEDRLAITNQALRELSGVNGLLVGDWIKAHADEVVSHNSKYGMQNPKDPSNPTTYYNKRHGSEKITKILTLVNESFLDGEAPVS
ncbi:MULTISPECIES: protelomerase family protein [unclassified Coleofasciculus]|uniref:protelomerase family protein n=1 Tax=unclassified Coleofasciculus TaxID=2692782 RepID=UPI001882AD0D|nr:MULTISPECIES: protelomerase family protein [unclassified Coleofasciculus]MBE9126946.1 hypothetical protein [Coleofasciculus sp. LEGE 07081]MBE9150252.1 hypothetical protein [Coleofasciculus sp. LEGE 07092]